MVAVVIAIHIIVCISLVIIVLLQQGKGAEVGAVFGGSSQTVFGATGAAGVLVRLTAVLAAIFFVTSLFLAYASTKRITGSIFEGNVTIPAATNPVGKTGAPPSGLPAAPKMPPSAPAAPTAPASK